MKKILSLLFTFIFSGIFSQSATTVANGNWTNPLIWNCTCVPVGGYSVTINHAVTLNTSLLFNTGGITVNAAGSLVQDAALNRDIWINGGYLHNAGNVDIRFFLASTGAASNSGSLTVDAMTNYIPYVNSGTITMDSMTIAGTFTNTVTGNIIGDSLTNSSVYQNYGYMNVSWFTNDSAFYNYHIYNGYAMTNRSYAENLDSILLTGSVWNIARFRNLNGALFKMNKSFHNYDPIGGKAVFDNNGSVVNLDSWFNTDTVKGQTGSFTVSDSSANSGFMKGNFSFCDLTPPSTYPYIDLNSGTVSPQIQFCSTGIHSDISTSFNVFPVPASKSLHIRFDTEEGKKISFLNAQGMLMYEISASKKDLDIDLSDFVSGIYFLRIQSDGKAHTRKIYIEK
jgi:hypothetical protein